ncbi:hypothetical protein C2S51_016342 [Perilla frutescens var. frutescens]|nr:hypothetical protein C2S51_016342 [Perilla frutescens var. frutescens]
MLRNGIHGYPVLLEIENTKQVERIMHEIGDLAFMIGGMPRPVRAKVAKVEMFVDRPKKSGRRIMYRWLQPSDPKHEVAMKIKKAVRRHAVEESFLLEEQLAVEENLAKNQNETLRVNHKKLKLIEDVFTDGIVE